MTMETALLDAQRMVERYTLRHKRDARDEWISYMMEYYRSIWPEYPEYCYLRWAEAAVDRSAESLGDYFSTNYYNTPVIRRD